MSSSSASDGASTPETTGAWKSGATNAAAVALAGRRRRVSVGVSEASASSSTITAFVAIGVTVRRDGLLDACFTGGWVASPPRSPAGSPSDTGAGCFLAADLREAFFTGSSAAAAAGSGAFSDTTTAGGPAGRLAARRLGGGGLTAGSLALDSGLVFISSTIRSTSFIGSVHRTTGVLLSPTGVPDRRPRTQSLGVLASHR